MNTCDHCVNGFERIALYAALTGFDFAGKTPADIADHCLAQSTDPKTLGMDMGLAAIYEDANDIKANQ